VSAANFLGGRKLSPKPPAERNIPSAQTFGLCSGVFRPAGGKFAQAQIYSSKEPDCIYPCRPEDGRMDGAAAYGYISW